MGEGGGGETETVSKLLAGCKETKEAVRMMVYGKGGCATRSAYVAAVMSAILPQSLDDGSFSVGAATQALLQEEDVSSLKVSK